MTALPLVPGDLVVDFGAYFMWYRTSTPPPVSFAPGPGEPSTPEPWYGIYQAWCNSSDYVELTTNEPVVFIQYYVANEPDDDSDNNANNTYCVHYTMVLHPSHGVLVGKTLLTTDTQPLLKKLGT